MILVSRECIPLNSHLFSAILVTFIFFNFLSPGAVDCGSPKTPAEFQTHHQIEIKLFSKEYQPLSFSQLKHFSCSKVNIIEILNDNITLRANVSSNNGLTPDHYFEKSYQNGLQLIRRKHEIKERKHCHYNGSLIDQSHSFVALSIYDHSLTGLIGDFHDVYHIHFDDQTAKHILLKSSQLKNGVEIKCGVETSHSPAEILSRRKRNSGRNHPHRINEKTRYVELVLVNDHAEFKNNCKKNEELVIKKSQQIANIVNGLFNQLNIFVALVGVVIWSEKDETEMSDNPEIMLKNFLRYRYTRLLREHPNDNSQLISGRSFKGGVVGKAYKGPICTYEYSGGVNTDHSDTISLVATTVAHEMGHNFGMEHDNDKDHCSCGQGEKCIMSDSSGHISPIKWSNCSIDYLNHALEHGMDYCLLNEPRKIVGPVCGNGFKEEGEECDCGQAKFCDNPCCIAHTCKLAPGAVCAMGECCNLESCSLIKKEDNQICRRSIGECDFAEFCDGESEFCPKNLHVQDGSPCASSEAFCFKGSCETHDSQCRRLWGPTGRKAVPECFRQNASGKPGGNCGKHRLNGTYVACRPEDVYCGLLHCLHLNEKLEFGSESAAEMHKIELPLRNDVCRTALIDLGLDVMDPGLAPNGAKCGENKMCLNQRCTSVENLKSVKACSNDCSGNGLCDNLGVCHCFDGYTGLDCEQPLPHLYYLTLALYIIFLCILPLTFFAAFIIYYFHSNIKIWWILRGRKSTIKSRAKQRNRSKGQHLNTANLNLKSLQISSPLPQSDNQWPNPDQVRPLPDNSAPPPPDNRPQSSLGQPQPMKIVPARPAPPPPVPSRAAHSTLHSPQPSSSLLSDGARRARHSSISRSSSTRSSSRPKIPPPKPPLMKDGDVSSSDSPSEDFTHPLTGS